MAELTGYGNPRQVPQERKASRTCSSSWAGRCCDAETACIKEGIRADRHAPRAGRRLYGAGLFAGDAGARRVHGGERPGDINFSTGLANALIDCCPVVALGGSSPISQFGRQVFQEIDQVAAMKALRQIGRPRPQSEAHPAAGELRLPEGAERQARARSISISPATCSTPRSTRPRSIWSYCGRPIVKARPYAEPKAIDALVDAIARPSSRSSSRAAACCGRTPGTRCRRLSRRPASRSTRPRRGAASCPTTTLYSYLTMRTDAFRDADLIIILGTRMNYVIGHAAPPRFSARRQGSRASTSTRRRSATSARNIDIRIVGDCKSVLQQAARRPSTRMTADRFQAWRQKLADGRGEEAHRRRRQLPDRRRHPSAAALRGGQELHAARRDPVGRRAGDPEFRPPVDPDLCAWPPAQFRAVRHDGRGAAVRGRRQGRQARRAGHLPARRRLVRAERDGARHRGAPQTAAAGGHQPQRRLDRRPRSATSPAATSATPATTRWPRRSAATANMSKSPRISARPWSARRQKVDEGMVGFVNVKTDYRARAGTLAFAQYST